MEVTSSGSIIGPLARARDSRHILIHGKIAVQGKTSESFTCVQYWYQERERSQRYEAGGAKVIGTKMGMGHNIVSPFGRKRRDNAPTIQLTGITQAYATTPSAPAIPQSDGAQADQGPTHNAGTDMKELPIEITIPFQSLALTTATSQISSLVFCLAWSVRFNFYESTATHCRVDNYLPSLSATLDFTPQRDVWRACIGLSGIPRYFIAYLYYRLIYRSNVLLWFHWIEISALIGLSIVDSIRYFGK